MCKISLIRQCLFVAMLALYAVETRAVVSGRAEASRQKGLPRVIESCPQKCGCSATLSRGQKITVDCQNQGLVTVPSNIPKTTLKLMLNSNLLVTVSHEEMKGLETLESLTLANNNLYKLEKNAFDDLSTLKDLDLSGNSLNSNTPVEIFQKLTYLENLNLTRNVFTHISNSRFTGLKDLQTLDLSANNVAGIDREAFMDLWSLEVLDLSGNRLNTIEHEWFEKLQNLKVLKLTNNKIKRISNTVFFALSGLDFLDISANNITTIGYLSFKGLSQVTTLDLNSNNFTILQEGTFKPMEKLKNVDLSNNPLRVFDGLFSSSSNLQELYMYNMYKLERLTGDSLRGLTGLKQLNLVDSNLNRVDPNAFRYLSSLKILNLQNNKLKSLPRGTFDPLGHGESIILKGNPWHCDCKFYWLLMWLGDNHRSHMSAPTDTTCQTPLNLLGTPILDALDHHMVCLNANITNHTPPTAFKLGSSATLTCETRGFPEPTLTWVTPGNLMFHWSKSLYNQTDPPKMESIINGSNNHLLAHRSGQDPLNEDQLQRFSLLKNGSLQVHNVKRSDSGLYYCTVSNALSNATAVLQLQIDAKYRFHIQIMSILVGLATSFAFLLLTLIGVMIDMIMDCCGWTCPCCSMSPKAKQIKKIMESMECYKSQQLDWLRDNYTSQVQKIKDNCMQQMEKLRESYSFQVEKLRDIRDYGTLQIDRIRDNYYMKVQIVRDYSTSQIDRLRENYVFQRNRVRKYSAHQFIKLRENYKLQQQHLNKILETLNLESCKTTCARTDSIIFEPELLSVDAVFPPLDLLVGVDLDVKPRAIPMKAGGGHRAISLPCSSSSGQPLLRDRLDSDSQISAYYTPEDNNSEISGSYLDKDHYCLTWDDMEDKNLILPPMGAALLHKPAKRDIGVSTSDLYLTPVIIVHKTSTDHNSSSDDISSCDANDHQEVEEPRVEAIDIQCLILTDNSAKLDTADEANETVV